MCVCFLLYVYQLELNLLLNVFLELADGQTYLLHSVAVTNGYAVVCRSVLVTNSLKVDGDAKRSTDFVLAAVTLTDRTGLIVVNHKVLGKLLVDLACLVTKLLGKRQNSSLKGQSSFTTTRLPFARCLAKRQASLRSIPCRLAERSK